MLKNNKTIVKQPFFLLFNARSLLRHITLWVPFLLKYCLSKEMDGSRKLTCCLFDICNYFKIYNSPFQRSLKRKKNRITILLFHIHFMESLLLLLLLFLLMLLLLLFIGNTILYKIYKEGAFHNKNNENRKYVCIYILLSDFLLYFV